MNEKSEAHAERYRLYDQMLLGKATARELVYLFLLMDIITVEQYAYFIEIEKGYGEERLSSESFIRNWAW